MPDTEMSIIGRNLPQGIRERGKEIRTFMPRWGGINERRNQLHEVIRLSGMNLVISETDHPLIIKVASIQSARMQVYFIDNEDYFQRKGIFENESGQEYEDNDERAIFFARGVLETVKKLRWAPDIVHCHGWFSCFVPLLIKRGYRDDPVFAKSRVVFSAYNDEFTNPLSTSTRTKLLVEGVTKKDVEPIRDATYLNVMQLAIRHSDGIIFGNPLKNKSILEYIDSIGKPVLPYLESDKMIDGVNDFYNSLLNAPTHVKP